VPERVSYIKQFNENQNPICRPGNNTF